MVVILFLLFSQILNHEANYSIHSLVSIYGICICAESL